MATNDGDEGFEQGLREILNPGPPGEKKAAPRERLFFPPAQLAPPTAAPRRRLPAGDPSPRPVARLVEILIRVVAAISVILLLVAFYLTYPSR